MARKPPPPCRGCGTRKLHTPDSACYTRAARYGREDAEAHPDRDRQAAIAGDYLDGVPGPAWVRDDLRGVYARAYATARGWT